MKINNEMYHSGDYRWWDEEDDTNALLRYFVNPIRFSYYKSIMDELPPPAGIRNLLDVGCGGGFLTEEFAKHGFDVSGVDPAESSLNEAQTHAAENGLDIAYHTGCGENLPFDNGSFNYVSCCDVLEHVRDFPKVISEISRVLKPGGVFFFDTVNRTFMSWITVIKVAQDWKFTAFEKPNTHLWSMFVKPAELEEEMKRQGLGIRDIKGISTGENPVSIFLNIRRRAAGKITRREMGERIAMHKGNDISISYMGYAIKNP